jgi:hypothetical protein
MSGSTKNIAIASAIGRYFNAVKNGKYRRASTHHGPYAKGCQLTVFDREWTRRMAAERVLAVQIDNKQLDQWRLTTIATSLSHPYPAK